jgi:uroporphyrin-III C-methyltransferase / precorrin-2 dehydrogenase / sirohydrochlorin ferrochelatase
LLTGGVAAKLPRPRATESAKAKPMSTGEIDETQLANAAARSARIEALATLPVFFKLGGKRVIVVGGSEPALWKAELLAAAGAHVDVYAEALEEGFRALAGSPPNGSVAINLRRWQPDDLKGATIAVGAITDNEDAAAFAAAARFLAVPVNVIDRPEFCDFQFGAIVNRSPLVLAISTDGASPVLAQAIRSLVEGLLPIGLKLWVAVAKIWRREVDRLGATQAERRRFWDRFADLALREAGRAPTQADMDELLAKTEDNRSQRAAPGAVTIIAVGTDAESLTLGAVRALRCADRILYDEGVSLAVLEFARREARRLAIGHLGSGEAAAIELTRLMVAEAVDNKRVVRLKSASASNIDGVMEEAEALRAAGLPTTIIPAALPI